MRLIPSQVHLASGCKRGRFSAARCRIGVPTIGLPPRDAGSICMSLDNRPREGCR